MESTENINKKLLIAIFTIPFLIGFIYSVYSQATSAQNNAAISSLESNWIFQWLNSTINSYSIAGQSLASFLSINEVPSYVWTIVIFLITTLFFIGIYTFLFEVFMQKAGIKKDENETMKKAIILFIFALSIFSALSIGFAIPFLLSLYGLALLILVIIALLFFGRAVISYGRGFHYATKSFAISVEKDLLELEKQLNKTKGEVSEENVNQIMKGINNVFDIYRKAKNNLEAADKKVEDILSKLTEPYESFINNLINNYNGYLNTHRNNLQYNQTQSLNTLIRELENYKNTHDGELQNMKSMLKNKISNSKNPDIRLIESIINNIKNLQNGLLKLTEELIKNSSVQDSVKNDLYNILNNSYNNALSQHNQILSEIKNAIGTYKSAGEELKKLSSYEKTFNDTNSKIRTFLLALRNKKYEIAISHALNELEHDIKVLIYSVDERIRFLEGLENLLESLIH
jgi:Sec-independent protein translocase protein TatA